MKVSQPRSLDALEFEGFKHTDQWPHFVKNRITITDLQITPDQWPVFLDCITQELEQLTTSCFHVCQRSGTVKVYFASASDCEKATHYISNQ